jgi:integrase
MARAIHCLKPLEIKNAQPRAREDGTVTPAMLNDGGGLYLRASPGANGAVHKGWIFRFSIKGKENQLSLGSYPDVSLKDARDRAAEQRKVRGEGQDPVTARRQEEKDREAAAEAKRVADALAAARTKTFRACAEEYIIVHQAGWKNGEKGFYCHQWRDLFERFVYPIIGDLPVADVDRPLVVQVLRPLWETKTTTAKILRAHIAKVLGFATAEGYRPATPNPAAWRENLQHSFPKPADVAPVEHHPALDYRQIGAFMARLHEEPGAGARALEFAILTASRAGEVRLAKWSEIDLEQRTWTVPAERMKMGKKQDRSDHVVPLSDAAVAILEAIKGDESPDPKGYIFVGRYGTAIATSGMLRIAQRINPAISTHGFRSCFSDWAGDCTDASEETREFCLAHVKTGVAGAYRRATAVQKRRALLQQWADYCNGVVVDNVVPLKRTA